MSRMRAPLALALVLLVAIAAPAVAADTLGERLEQLRALHAAGRHTATESLATELRVELESQAHPDTLALARVLHVISTSRNQRHLIADTLGLGAGRRSLRLLEACRCGPDTLLKEVHRVLGWWSVFTRESRTGLEHYRTALAIARRHPEWDPTVPSVLLYNVGTSLANLGENDSALTVLHEGLALRLAMRQPHDPLPSELYAMIGSTLDQLGRDELAERAFDEAIRVAETNLGPTHRGLGGPLSRAAAFQFRRGDYARAYDLYQRASEVLTDPVNHLIVEGGMAQALEQLGDAAGARRVLERTTAELETRLGPRNPQVLSAWLSLGSACDRLGEPARALELYARIRASFAGDTSRSERAWLIAAWNSEAQILRRQGRVDSALVLAERVERASREDGAAEYSSLIQSLALQLALHGARRDWAAVDRTAARLEPELARVASQSNNLTDDVWTARSEVAMRRGRRDEAFAAALAGARIARERLQSNVRALSDRQGLRLASRLSPPLDLLLRRGAWGDSAQIRLTWDELVRTRGLVRAEISRRRRPPDAATDTALATTHAAWLQAERRLAQFEVSTAGAARDAATDSTRAALRAAVDAAERRLVRGATPPEPAANGLAEVLARLPADAALVSFARASDERERLHLVAFVARGAASPAVTVDLGPLETLTAAVQAWRRALGATGAARPTEAACRRLGEVVRARVWGPLQAATGGAAGLFIVPDAPLDGLPWGALPAGPRGYWVESGPRVHVLSAERDLLPSPEAPTASGLLALGGVDYDREVTHPEPSPSALRAPLSECDRAALSNLPPLPATAGEVDDVIAAWEAGPAAHGRALRLAGDAATEAEFKRLAPGQRVLHLATHGIALADSCAPGVNGARGTRGVGGVGALTAAPGNARPAARRRPPRPAAAAPAPPSPWLGRQVLLALADANHAFDHGRDSNEGLLTAEEVTTLDLRGVDWVVLSACHSGIGEAWAREGVLGMQRAFRLAGARTVIASQWSIDDDATREWMRALYQARAAGATRAADALAAASRATLATRRREGRSTHPFYWAAFSADGD